MNLSSLFTRDALGRRGFLIGAGAVGGGAAWASAALLTHPGTGTGAGAGRAVATRPDLMTAALGSGLERVPGALTQARATASRSRGGVTAAARAARAAEELAPFADRLPVPPVLRGRGGRLTVSMRTASVRLHRDLPATRLWTYEGGHLGPTIEARSGQRLRIAWENDLTGAFPLAAVRVPFAFEEGQPLMWDRPGREGADPRGDVAALPPWTAVHLHGAVTGGGNDGWAENAVLPGHAQLSEYPNQQAATGLWYHDHAMHITHLNVMSGLAAGAYLIRDAEEDGLDLPAGERELPLVLFDRNLDLDAEGRFTGDLLYKGVVVADDPYELVRPFTGPFTLVNGRIWPYAEVAGGWYRLRRYTIRHHRPELGEVDLDFVLHGADQLASGWAERATVGEESIWFGPSPAYPLREGAAWSLLLGDETALPALGVLLEELPAGHPVTVLAEIADPDEQLPLPTRADADIRWLHRGDRPPAPTNPSPPPCPAPAPPLPPPAKSPWAQASRARPRAASWRPTRCATPTWTAWRCCTDSPSRWRRGSGSAWSARPARARPPSPNSSPASTPPTAAASATTAWTCARCPRGSCAAVSSWSRSACT